MSGRSALAFTYADKLVLTAKSKGTIEQKFLEWKRPLENKVIKVNIGKTELMVTGKKSEANRSGRHLRGVCGLGVG